ncbi:unnamed protein product [Parascedosporium putredinis]|uniref:Uncharacterized protein n=1 Tax=Parascedosporium putredinis TaxID=1442378 RepID=A0A9P1MDD1_9PEZI|nr:unnamed protein product [Parascedosporium putredinis]CAI7998408.1 unnamed protein product [Parascedosporium putredinis]
MAVSQCPRWPHGHDRGHSTLHSFHGHPVLLVLVSDDRRLEALTPDQGHRHGGAIISLADLSITSDDKNATPDDDDNNKTDCPPPCPRFIQLRFRIRIRVGLGLWRLPGAIFLQQPDGILVDDNGAASVDRIDSFLDSGKSESTATPLPNQPTFFRSSPSSEGFGLPESPSSQSSALDCFQESLPDHEASKPSMAGAAYMPLSTRPLTAQEYQRYRSQRRGGDGSGMSPTTAGFTARCASDGRYQAGLRSAGASALGTNNSPVPSPTVHKPTPLNGGSTRAKITKPMVLSRDRRASRIPSISSPGMMTREEFESLPPAIQRKVSA